LFDGLTKRQQQFIQSYFMDHMSMTEIAEEHGLNVSTVSRTIARGRARLITYAKCGAGLMASRQGKDEDEE